MKLLDLTLPTIAENLALDEALLDEADQFQNSPELLRLWEAPSFAVVVGRGTNVQNEINQDACAADSVPILRRCSGGTSVVAGPGCLMYALLIRYSDKQDLRSVDNAHGYVMQRMVEGLRDLDRRVEFSGSCDLTLENRKFSGNALRCKRNCFLYHGTLLYNFELPRISKYLGTPPRQPDYREDRDHDSFVRNFSVSSDALRAAICQAWQPAGVRTDWPRQETENLVQTKYQCRAWNLRR